MTKEELEKRKIEAQEGYIFKRISDGFLFDKIIYLGDNNSKDNYEEVEYIPEPEIIDI